MDNIGLLKLNNKLKIELKVRIFPVEMAFCKSMIIFSIFCFVTL